MVWTVRIDGEQQPFLWQKHEGPESVKVVEATVKKATDAGHDVIVECRKERPRW